MVNPSPLCILGTTSRIPNTCNKMSFMRPLHFLALLVLIVCGSCFVEAVKKPNIVFIITDDQDLVLGGMVSYFCLVFITKKFFPLRYQ